MNRRIAQTAALLAGAAVTHGCRDRPNPAEPVVIPSITASALGLAPATASRWETAALTVDDARTRLVPALGDQASSGAVGGTLTALAETIAAADPSAIASVVDAARKAIDRYAATADASRRANVDAVRLAVDAVAELTLNGSGTEQP